MLSAIGGFSVEQFVSDVREDMVLSSVIISSKLESSVDSFLIVTLIDSGACRSAKFCFRFRY